MDVDPMFRPLVAKLTSPLIREAEGGYTQRPRLRRVLRLCEGESSRVPAASSGMERAWFRELHHPLPRFARGLAPWCHGVKNQGASQSATFRGKIVPLVPADPVGQ